MMTKTHDVNDKWQAVLDTLKLSLSPTQFTNFNGSTATLTAGNELIVSPSSAMATARIKNHLLRALTRAVKSIYDPDVSIAIQENFIDDTVESEDLPSIPQTNVLPKGFTPVVDSLALELGLVAAAIYGVVWRYCQMNSSTCYASQKTIAERLKLTRKCVNQNIKTLLNDGYIRCLNEKEIGKTKVYIVTDKVSIKVGVSIEATVNGQV